MGALREGATGGLVGEGGDEIVEEGCVLEGWVWVQGIGNRF